MPQSVCLWVSRCESLNSWISVGSHARKMWPELPTPPTWETLKRVCKNRKTHEIMLLAEIYAIQALLSSKTEFSSWLSNARIWILQSQCHEGHSNRINRQASGENNQQISFTECEGSPKNNHSRELKISLMTGEQLCLLKMQNNTQRWIKWTLGVL